MPPSGMNILNHKPTQRIALTALEKNGIHILYRTEELKMNYPMWLAMQGFRKNFLLLIVLLRPIVSSIPFNSTLDKRSMNIVHILRYSHDESG